MVCYIAAAIRTARLAKGLYELGEAEFTSYLFVWERQEQLVIVGWLPAICQREIAKEQLRLVYFNSG